MSEKYDMRKHGVNVTVRNKHTGKKGVVTTIRETYHEWIQPFVIYEGTTHEVKETDTNLEFIDDGRKAIVKN